MSGFYDGIAIFYDLFIWGSERRYHTIKENGFAGAHGRCLLVGVGTGIDLPLLPPDLELTAIDLSPHMLARAKKRAKNYKWNIQLLEANIEKTDFPDAYFDTVITSCVFCSVGDPVKGLKEVRRVLKPGGRLIMFEHVLSKNPLLKPMLYFMSLLIPGPEMTRDTVANVKEAGFQVVKEKNVYMDIVKRIEAI